MRNLFLAAPLLLILTGCATTWTPLTCRPAYAISKEYDPTAVWWQMEEIERQRCAFPPMRK